MCYFAVQILMPLMKKIIMREMFMLLQAVKVCHMVSVVPALLHLIAMLCRVHLDLDKLLQIVHWCVFCLLVWSF